MAQNTAAAAAAAAAATADVEAALKEVDRAMKKQKVCAQSSAAAIDILLQVRGWVPDGCRVCGAGGLLLQSGGVRLPGGAGRRSALTIDGGALELAQRQRTSRCCCG